MQKIAASSYQAGPISLAPLPNLFAPGNGIPTAQLKTKPADSVPALETTKVKFATVTKDSNDNNTTKTEGAKVKLGAPGIPTAKLKLNPCQVAPTKIIDLTPKGLILKSNKKRNPISLPQEWKLMQPKFESAPTEEILEFCAQHQIDMSDYLNIYNSSDELDEKYFSLFDYLNYELIQRGIVGYLGHFIVSTSRCLELALMARDHELIKYYILRRCTITRKAWQLALLWGDIKIYKYLLHYSEYDFITECYLINNNIEFIEEMIDLYQRATAVEQKNWLLRLIGASLTIEQTEQLELPPIMLREVVKGMVTNFEEWERRHAKDRGEDNRSDYDFGFIPPSLTKLETALTKWNMKFTPYLAGMTGKLNHYDKYLYIKNVSDPSYQNAFIKSNTDDIYSENGVDAIKYVYAGLMEIGKPVSDEYVKAATDNIVKLKTGIHRIMNGFHPISWFYRLAYLGTLTEGEAQRQGVEYMCHSFSLEYRFDIALKEGNFEMLMLLEQENPLDYNYVLEKANTPLIAQWVFDSAKEKGFALDPKVRPILSIDDPYFRWIREVCEKNGHRF